MVHARAHHFTVETKPTGGRAGGRGRPALLRRSSWSPLAHLQKGLLKVRGMGCTTGSGRSPIRESLEGCLCVVC
eukprot:9622171-Lingulodinium_polyedra.AAC.1